MGQAGLVLLLSARNPNDSKIARNEQSVLAGNRKINQWNGIEFRDT